MKTTVVVLAGVISLGSAWPAAAQMPNADPGDRAHPVDPADAIRGAVVVGAPIVVIDENGSRLEGRLLAVTDDELRVVDRRREVGVSLARIVRLERPDGVADGAGKGFAVGATTAIFIGLLASAEHGRGAAAILPGLVMWSGLFYAGVGAGIDALHDGQKTLYERGQRRTVRLTPIVQASRRGAAVVWSW